ncbi:DinB family protein [Marinoscillum furvescens]|uniref:DinB family protein n=1 Tax=Marinoscillum furvescens DSM 4134 TaxID=1122208 RepID=A0A3D9KWQ0_MARFU|nr:DinB family protein [Marinoscillum furvescens]RED91502.1 DinB family protein [Marinoscillum furvescens DSM 4134]
MKKLLNVLVILAVAVVSMHCSSGGAEATAEAAVPDTTYAFVEAHAPVWQSATSQVLALIDSMPADMLSYRPHDSVRTFAEQIVHIGGSSTVIANYFLKDVPPPSERPEMDVAAMSKDDLKAFVQEQLAATWDIMKGMSDQELAQKVKSFSGNEITRQQGMLLVQDHMTNHKSKANLYIRVSGNEPPRYGYH